MSADRLRQAADAVGEWAEDWPDAEGAPQDRATAALLRAVADDIADWCDRLENWPEPITLGPPTRGWDAALDLASAILGDTSD